MQGTNRFVTRAELYNISNRTVSHLPAEPSTDLFKDSHQIQEEIAAFMSKTIDVSDPAVKKSIQELRRRNSFQLDVLNEIKGEIGQKYKGSVAERIENLRKEALFYLNEYFDNLHKGFSGYSQDMSSNVVFSKPYRELYEKIKADKKLIDDLDSDVTRFDRFLVLRETYNNYMDRLNRTEATFQRLTEKRLLPEVLIHKEPDFDKKLMVFLRDNIYYENNLADDIKDSIEAMEDVAPQEETVQSIGARMNILSTDPSINIVDFVHYFEENKAKLHIARLNAPNPGTQPNNPQK